MILFWLLFTVSFTSKATPKPNGFVKSPSAELDQAHRVARVGRVHRDEMEASPRMPQSNYDPYTCQRPQNELPFSSG